MSLIDLPQTKWGSGTGRQVILKGDFAKIEAGGDGGLRIHPGARAGIRGQRHPPGQRHGRLPGPGDDVRLSFPPGPGPLGGRGPERRPLPGERRPGEPQSGHRRASLGHREVRPVVCRLCPGGSQRRHLLPESHAGHAGGLPGQPGDHPEEQRQWGQHRLRVHRQRTGGGRPPDPQRGLPGPGPGHHRQQ